jgi:HlyD family secretion protein
MNLNKIIIAGIIALSMGTITYVIYKRKCAAIKQNPYQIENPTYRDLTQYVTATGNLKARDQISVGSLVAGKVIKIMAEDNDIVKKDQVLIVLDDGVGDADIKKAQANLAEAEANATYLDGFFKRQEALFKSGQLSKNLYEQYKKDLDISRARIDQIKADLQLKTQTFNNLFIKSPDDGIVIAKKVDLGQMVTAVFQATVLFEIAKDLHCMEADLDVDEADIGMVKEGQDALFSVDAFPKEKFSAKVKRIEYQAKIIDNVVTYATVLDVSNPELRLRPGMTTNVEINVAHAEHVLSISNRAFRVSTSQLEEVSKKLGYTVKKIQDGVKKTISKQMKTSDTLWVLEDGKNIKQIEVKLGINDGKYTQIINGIDEKTKIIADLDISAESPLLKSVFGRAGGIGR